MEEPRGRIDTVLAGRYRILRLLGEGAGGAVYVGEHIRIGRKDAVRILPPALLDDDDATARFRRKASRASLVHHANVCTVYDFGVTGEGLPFIASELVSGRRLDDVIQADAPVEPGRAVDLLEQVAAGLAAAHELGVVHGNLRPSNVLLVRGPGGQEVVKILDIGLVAAAGRVGGGGSGESGWTPDALHYMSPEQITGAEIDWRSDIYSLALVFFEMLTGRVPHDGGSAAGLVEARVGGVGVALDRATPSGPFPPSLHEALARALTRDPDDRFPSAIDLARCVREAVTASGALTGDRHRVSATVPDVARVPAGEPASVPPVRTAGGRSATTMRSVGTRIIDLPVGLLVFAGSLAVLVVVLVAVLVA